jgi:hypothetical protein
MKNFSIIVCLILSLFADKAFSQCTPVNCLASLPPYGGICETEIAEGLVNEDYYDSISFHITTNCIDGALLGDEYAGTSYKVTSLHTFQVSNLPIGMEAATNQATYISPANGCAALFGIPTEAGVFSVNVSFMVNVNVWLVSSSCSGFLPPVAQNDNLITSNLDFVVLPDPSFIGATDGDIFCSSDDVVYLTPIGTPGGIFSGLGTAENTFSPVLAGPGVHQITYTVTAQEGNAIGPATNSQTITVEVLGEEIFYYVDNDGDGYGNPDLSTSTCIDPGEGWVTNGEDCDDNNPLVYPDAAPTGTGLDNNCDGVIDDLEAGVITSIEHVTDDRALIFPNPAKNLLNVQLPNSLTDNVDWSILDLSGRTLLTGRDTGSNLIINLITLSEGFYLLRIKQQPQQTSLKFGVVR